jgi:hypothetical protein
MIWCEAVLVKPILTRKCRTKVKTCFESKHHEQSENTFLDDGRMVAMFALGVTTSSTLFALSIKCRTNPDCMIPATAEGVFTMDWFRHITFRVVVASATPIAEATK